MEHNIFIKKIDKAFRKYGKKTAISYLGNKITYQDLGNHVDNFLAGLLSLGIKQNDKVIIFLPNTPQYVIAFFAIIKIGAVAVPISPIYTSIELAYIANDCNAETIVCQDRNIGYVREVMAKTKIARCVYTNIADMVSLSKRIIGILFDKIPYGNVQKDPSTFKFSDILKIGSKCSMKNIIIPNNELACIIYTGGTTGYPKGVPMSHNVLYYEVYELMDVLQNTIIAEGKTPAIMQLPFFHIFGLCILLCFGILQGNTSILIPQPVVDGILECIQKYKAKLFFAVPTLYRMILENRRIDRYDLSSLLYCWSGGDALPSEVYNRWKRKYNMPIHQIYGSTETSSISMTDLNREPEIGSLGKPITAGGKIFKIIEPATLNDVKEGEAGELLVYAPWFMNYYLNNEIETRAAFIELDGKIFYRTKDIIRIKNGEMYFVDRTADIIKYKGYRVSACEIEIVLQDHHAVLGACVVGVPDEKVGERIKAFVVMREDVRGVGSNDLIKWCRNRMSPYKVPQYIEVRDMLPKSKVGKLLRREIREEERKKFKSDKKFNLIKEKS